MKIKTLLTPLAIPFVVAIFASIAGDATAQEAKDKKITFDDHVKPILMQRCSSCHNNQRKEADLDVTNYTAMMLGGGSGEVVSPGDAGSSYLYKLITHEDSPEMPPSGTKIPDPEIKTIAAWINGGALENAGSKPRKAKPKMDLAIGADATKRPEIVAVPLRMPLEPVIRPKRPSANAIATSPWAALAAIATPKQILLYNTKDLQLIGVLPMEEGLAHTLKFSRNGSLLLAGGGKDGQSGQTIIWDVRTGERITTVGEELDTVLAADISSDHQYVALGGPSKLVKVFSIVDGTVLHEINKHTDWVTAMEFSPDGKFLATGDRNGGLHVWETETGGEVYTLKAHTKAITGVSWRTDSKILASASEDTTIRVWEMNKGGQIKNWGAHGGGVTSIEFLRDGNIVSSGRDKVAKTWKQDGGMIKQFPGMPDVTMSVSYCDETNRVLCSDWTGEVRVWNAADAAQVGILVANPPKLAERLAAAEQLLQTTSQKHAPLATQLQQTQTKLTQTTTTLNQVKQSKAQKDTAYAQVQKQFNAAKQQFESTTTQHQQWRKELTEKTTAKPLIDQTFTKATEAAKALPNDAELKQSAQAMEAKSKQIAARIVELNELIKKSDQEKNTTKAQMDQLAATMKTSKTELDKMTAQITQMESAVNTITQQLNQQQTATDAAQKELDFSKQLVNRWKSDIAFIEQLKNMKAQLSQVEEVVSQKQAVVEQAHQKLMEAQKVVDDAKQQKQATEAQADQVRQQILKLRGG